jgi:putative transcriptional regulator
LEAEIARNDWLTVDAAKPLIFSQANGGKWAEALRAIGVDPLSLSSKAGRA